MSQSGRDLSHRKPASAPIATSHGERTKGTSLLKRKTSLIYFVSELSVFCLYFKVAIDPCSVKKRHFLPKRLEQQQRNKEQQVSCQWFHVPAASLLTTEVFFDVIPCRLVNTPTFRESVVSATAGSVIPRSFL